MKVVVRYFVRTTECTGKYISLTGTVVMIDPVYRELKVMQDSNRKAVGIEKELPVIIPLMTLPILSLRASLVLRTTLGKKSILMKHKTMTKHRLEVQNVVNYYFCDVCHYCFEAESLPGLREA